MVTTFTGHRACAVGGIHIHRLFPLGVGNERVTNQTKKAELFKTFKFTVHPESGRCLLLSTEERRSSHGLPGKTGLPLL